MLCRTANYTLANCYQSFSRPSPPHSKYLGLVSSLCDEAMQEIGENWRHGFYALALNTALIISFQVNNRQQILSANTQFTSHGRDNGDDSSETYRDAIISPTVADNIHSGLCETMLPITLNSSDDVSHCPRSSCPAIFTGSYQKGNLERHLKYARHHNQDALFECGICHKTIGRADNLQQHLRNKHKVVPSVTRKGTRSRGDIEG